MGKTAAVEAMVNTVVNSPTTSPLGSQSPM
jgi:hypothetical protein